MATTTLLTVETRARRTTVSMKILMAITGALFVFYVLIHMYGNLKLFAGQAAFDEYADHLREIGQPILPYSGFLWIFRVLLIVSLARPRLRRLLLWARARGARANRYAVRSAAKGAARSTWMRWGGVALLLFLVFHLVQFTVPKVNFNSSVPTAATLESPYRLVVASFQLWWVVLIYVAAMAALGLHLHHGVWSGAQTLGWANSAHSRRVAKATGHVVAAVIVVGFILPPLSILVRPREVTWEDDTMTETITHGLYLEGEPIADTKAPAGPIEERWTKRKFEAKLVNPANRRKLSVIIVGTGLAGGAAAATLGEAGYNVKVVLLPGLPAPGALDRRPGRHQRRQELQGGRRLASTGSSTTPSRAATTAPASPTSTGWPRSARTSSTSASPRACRSPASTAACSTTAPSAASRSRAPSTPAARPASSC